MHNCNQMNDKMTDLLFAPPPAPAQQMWHNEINQCAHCKENFAALCETLTTFQQSATLALPPESYWNNYEARLRTRLAAPAPSAQNFFSNLRSMFLRPSWLVPALLLLCGLALGTIWQLRDPSPQLVKENGRLPEIQSAPPSVTDNQKSVTPENIIAVRQSNAAPKRKAVAPAKTFHALTTTPPAPLSVAAFEPTVLPLEMEPPPQFSALEITRHLEKAQMLLRGFRNAQPSEDGTIFDMTEERQRARALLQTTVQLRRSAEATGDLPLEDAISTLEPVLLDLANLPERAALDDVLAIKARLYRNEIVGLLQNYTQSFAATIAAAD